MKNSCALNWSTPLYFFLFVFLLSTVSCSDQTKEQPIEAQTATAIDSSSTATAVEQVDSSALAESAPQEESTVFVAASKAKYNGEWFSIEYPTSFASQPEGPKEKHQDYAYIATDEARFTSPDKQVEFFVYSPQWSGEPKDYLLVADNEELVTDKTTPEEVAPENVHRWVSIKAKDGSYQRAFYSKTTPSTHKVFGIKYTDQAAYDKYKSAYTDFKDSLEQYSD